MKLKKNKNARNKGSKQQVLRFQTNKKTKIRFRSIIKMQARRTKTNDLHIHPILIIFKL
jgi:hypothetical protein